MKLCEISWDLLKKYFHLKSKAVYNSSAKNSKKVGQNWSFCGVGKFLSEGFSSFNNSYCVFTGKQLHSVVVEK